jgi:predicted RNA polymerase sigma factor
VLDAVYAAFAEGWSDAGGTDAVRRDLTEEAIFLARLAAELLPEEPEAPGLLALMLHAEARRRARRDAEGEYVPFAEQNAALWDWGMIEEAEGLLRRQLAIAEVEGASAGLAALEPAASDARLAEYPPYWAARAELLARTGTGEEARRAYGMAVGLERDAAVRRFLLRRQAALPG